MHRFVVLLLFAGTAFAEVRFNRDVRPILSDRCYACHGPDGNNRKTKMRLDVEGGAGASILAGDAEASPVYKRLISTSKTLRMPPAYLGHDALPASDVAMIRQWITEGAKYEKHWSFIPPVRPALSAVQNSAWARNPIDRFVLNRLEREGLKPSPEADRRTLIRRVTLDLTGLPPTPAEVEAFVGDASPKAYDKVVDRLLASTRYAERMAIRWLEAARYADTNGYQTDGPRTMWRWRDWVIDAFHKDMPYDRFTIDQLAGDLLPNPTTEQLIATGFHRNNRTSAEGGSIDEELRVEYVADRTETTSTVWLGLTVGCARCHDHKFDPVPQKDYYSLFSFFNNVPERGFVWNFGNEDPLMKAPRQNEAKRLAELDDKVAAARAAADKAARDLPKLQRKWEQQIKAPGWTVSDGLGLRVAEQKSFDGKAFTELADGPKFNYQDPFTFSARVRPETPNGALLSKGEDDFEGLQHALYILNGKLRLHITFRWSDLALRLETVQPLKLNEWQHVAVSYDGKRRASGVRVYVDGKPQEVTVLMDQLLNPLSTKLPWRLGAGGGMRFQGSLEDVRVYTRVLTADEVAALTVSEPVEQLAALKKRSAAQETALRLCYLDTAAAPVIRSTRAALAAAEAERNKYAASLPETMVMRERDEVRDTFILKRGAYDAHGDKVARAVPAVLGAMPESYPRNRLGLAQWLVDRKNPLTARTTVNRWWAMLFGTGIVKTVEDLGSQGEWPGNQDLLDWLAVEFMDSGWGVKHMLRTMVTSATYRQSSRVTPELLQRDPENRLLARGARFRLSAEMIRDQALAASGLLVDKVGGPSVMPYQPPGLWQELTSSSEYNSYKQDTGEGLYRRSLYSYWRRTIAPPSMVNFDSPTREVCTVRENRTNTPLQALNLMNEVTYVEASRRLAERLLADGGASAESRIAHAFRLVLARDPKPEEVRALSAALERFRAYYAQNPAKAEQFVAHGTSKPTGPGPELAAYAGIAGIVLNLDEAVTKE
ncbi:MAG: DUF1553 domain-containing protein [Bryobacteraceae bacterium]|nr:DUF1553 domain-containing protein [Bryobacteraceae bacterium]